ncbi:MAG: L-glutamate gamma-semialdehyde dehydrogenase [Sandaracinaceae bacterium]|nr:L-glutamate gamma-semialdehyde dehydrogenase [Sandaracinaceae bacterium]
MAQVPTPVNEPVGQYAPGSRERASLKAALDAVARERVEIPAMIGGEAVRAGRAMDVVMPHAHAHVLATAHAARPEDVGRAIERAVEARREWSRTRFEDRAAVFLRAAELLTTTWRDRVNAACMLGQSKTCFQSEIDAVCELADFWRFNVAFAERIYAEQPISPRGQWNRLDHRPLEGFVLAITPFNFLSIAANLPTAPLLMGNVVVWKPATTSLRGAWEVLALLRAAGLPDGVLSMVPGAGAEQAEVALDSEHLAGVHFTGSTGTFKALWRGISARLDRYRTFPRLVGETGGKDFVIAHESADPDAVATALVRGAFEYQGQKCSAASRAYVPASMWPRVKERVAADLASARFGDVRDFTCFGGAVIDRRAFDKIRGYVELGRATATLVAGGGCDDAVGFFIEPTVLEVADPRHRLMEEEIFGPVLAVYPYAERFEDVLALADATSPYALTGAVFARDRAAVRAAEDALRDAAGNFYVNDKPTGAVVGQQPFGGARQSGTNDKAGMYLNLLRWVSPRAIKETFAPSTDYRYPFMDEP